MDALYTITGGLAAAVSCTDVRALDDEKLLAVTGNLAGLARRVDALQLAATAEVGERSRKELGVGGLAARKGCRSPVELLERITGVSGTTAARRLKLGVQTRPNLSLAGIEFPAQFPQVSAGLESGALAFDQAEAIVKGLLPALGHTAIDGLKAAERELVAAATGFGSSTGAESTVPCSADEVRVQAQVWCAVLDPDGLEPAEVRAMGQRGFTRGTLRGGLIRGSYALLPEIHDKLNRQFDAYLSPRTAPAFLNAEETAAHGETGADLRSRDQQRHDVLAVIIDVAARSAEAPTIGGAAPTVLVSVRAQDLKAGRGVGFIHGVQAPISMRAVEQFVCTGGTQTVVLDDGRILGLGSPQRCFTPTQRRAITLRGGGCLIPGCTIPAAWTEIHHVNPAANDGPTHTDNGICLCWFHHRTIETSGWLFRMIRGAPQVKAPPWLEPHGKWRPATKSRTALADRIEKLTEHEFSS